MKEMVIDLFDCFADIKSYLDSLRGSDRTKAFFGIISLPFVLYFLMVAMIIIL